VQNKWTTHSHAWASLARPFVCLFPLLLLLLLEGTGQALTHSPARKQERTEGDWINLSFGQQQHALMTGISPHYSMTMTNGPGQGLLLDNLGLAAADA
jgi:hypothetical protein